MSSNGMDLSPLDKRRSATDQRIQDLQARLVDAEDKISGKACVYVTGSCGRRDASKHSDVDLVIVGKRKAKEDETSALNFLDSICVKADLIRAARDLKIPDFDADGRYLSHYSVAEFIKTLGKPEDDYTNRFTARLLLLLESQPLLGASVYNDVITEVIAAYCEDYQDHSADFVPAFLANDILRLWRTLCVNYEANTQRDPPERKAKRKLKNYKLKHSRLLTCYSALLYLLAEFKQKASVSPDDIALMVGLTPTERLQDLLKRKECSEAHSTIETLLDLYAQFLDKTDMTEKELISKFENKADAATYLESASDFGARMLDALNAVGSGTKFHRMIFV